ncbi:MAG: STAS/SEC14 domain-containing protein [Methylococcaceae bacterium]|nr:STAS/SEC14 domain-containing protein [Methylococcaceae bacterium]
MSYQLIKSFDSESWIKLSGKLTVHDFQELQSLAKLSLERFGQFRLLVELDGFQGWSREPGWEDSFFIEEDGNQISRIAFIGDEHWKDDVYMFTGKPMRKTAIEFFSQEQFVQAKAWLSEKNAHSIFLE